MTARSVTGWPVGTIVRGRRVMWEGEITGPAAGAPVGFLRRRLGQRHSGSPKRITAVGTSLAARIIAIVVRILSGWR